jgi:carbonic anhydrase
VTEEVIGIGLQTPVVTSACQSMRQLRETPAGRARIKEGLMKLVGAVYELDTGRVRLLD